MKSAKYNTAMATIRFDLFTMKGGAIGGVKSVFSLHGPDDRVETAAFRSTADAVSQTGGTRCNPDGSEIIVILDGTTIGPDGKSVSIDP